MRYERDTVSKVAVYCRVSTLDQSKGIESQEHALHAYLQGHGITDAVWHSDKVGGGTLKRPGFEQLQRDIFLGNVNTVICWKLDRLSRSLRDGVNTLADWLEKGVRVVAVSQQLDFSGSVGQMVASVLFAVAQMERENLRENTKRGLANARAKGIRLGRKPKLDDATVKSLHASGMGVTDLATRLGVTRQAIHQSLRRASKTA